MRISVVMPTFNRAYIITEAIESVLRQSYSDWELLIVDDGSSDDTGDIISSRFKDPRINYIPWNHVGVSEARNHGVATSTGEIITYLDTDNVWYPGYLRAVHDTYAADDRAMCAYAALAVEGSKTEPRIVRWEAFNFPRLMHQNYIDLNIFSHRRELYDRLGGFDPRMTRLVDWDLITRYVCESVPTEIPVVGALYRTGASDRITAIAPYDENLAIFREKNGG